MNRSTARGVPLVTFLFATSAYAADPGFYFAATASRVEHDVEGFPGIRTLVAIPSLTPPPVLIIVPPPSFGVITPIPPIAAIVPEAVEIDEVDAGFSATVGYRINRYVAAELSYTDFGEYERIDRFSGVPDVRYRLGVSGPSVSVLGSVPLGETWELYLRGGVLFAEQEVSFEIVSASERDFSDEVVTVGAGVQWAFAPRWAARLEYQSTDDLEYDRGDESSIDQASVSVVFKL